MTQTSYTHISLSVFSFYLIKLSNLVYNCTSVTFFKNWEDTLSSQLNPFRELKKKIQLNTRCYWASLWDLNMKQTNSKKVFQWITGVSFKWHFQSRVSFEGLPFMLVEWLSCALKWSCSWLLLLQPDRRITRRYNHRLFKEDSAFWNEPRFFFFSRCLLRQTIGYTEHPYVTCYSVIRKKTPT